VSVWLFRSCKEVEASSGLKTWFFWQWNWKDPFHFFQLTKGTGAVPETLRALQTSQLLDTVQHSIRTSAPVWNIFFRSFQFLLNNSYIPFTSALYVPGNALKFSLSYSRHSLSISWLFPYIERRNYWDCCHERGSVC
jgi:hypothetical protein